MTRLRTRSFRTQIVLTTMALTALGMLVVGIGLQVLLHHSVQRNLDHVLREQTVAEIQATKDASQHRLTVPDGALNPGDVVFDADGSVVDGRTAARLTDAAADLADVQEPTYTDVEQHDRLLAVPFETPADEAGVVVVAEPLAPYERAQWYVGLATVVIGVLVVGGVGVIARLVTSRALAPVARMARTATEWSDRDLAQRFELGPPVNEISALGATLDRLLERVAMTIRGEQRLTAELAHELRSPLEEIQRRADAALARGVGDDAGRADLEQISAAARRMGETITMLLELARDAATSAGGTSRLGDVLDRVAGAVPPELRAQVEVEDPEVRLAAPADLAERALAPVVANAVRHAVSAVALEATLAGAAVEIRVSDDGEGVDESVRDTLFASGSTGPSGGTGMGLGTARQVARSLGGDVMFAEGAQFLVRLPRL